MTQIKSRTFLGALLLCLSWIPAQAQTLYRLTPIVLDPPAQTALFSSDLNDEGQVVGRTFVPSGSGSIATLWSEGAAVDLNERISADDPLQPFVTLDAAELIDDQGRIVSTGFDSRTPNRLTLYVLTPVL